MRNNNEDEDEDEEEEGEGGTISFVLFSNCKYSHYKGKPPKDGRLKAAFTLKEGNEEENFLVFGRKKVPFPTAYVTVQIALDGTQERIGQFGGEESPEKLDANKWMTARAARAQAKKDARTAAMACLSGTGLSSAAIPDPGLSSAASPNP